MILAAARGATAGPTALRSDIGQELPSDANVQPPSSLGNAYAVNVGQTHLLVGCDVLVYRTEKVERFNSALFINSQGKLLDRYGKMHLVMFGEYIPLGPLLQWLRDLVGLPGMDAGKDVKSFAIGDVRVAPNICFESMMPRVINSQVR